MLLRALYIGSAAALVAAGLLLLGAPVAVAAPPPPPFGISVDPNHGRPTAPVNATFRPVDGANHCPAKAAFYWDGQPVGTADFKKGCTATFRFVPPQADRAPGDHVVSATAGTRAAAARYTVDPVASPSASPTPSPTAAPPTTPVPPTTPAASPSRFGATPTPDVPTEDASFIPGVSDSTPAAVALGLASELPVAPSSSSGGLVNRWALIAGGGLVLVGAMAMGLLFLTSRRTADEDADTVVLPVVLDGLLPDPAGHETPTIEGPRRPAPDL